MTDQVASRVGHNGCPCFQAVSRGPPCSALGVRSPVLRVHPSPGPSRAHLCPAPTEPSRGAFPLPCETRKTHLTKFPARAVSPKRGPCSVAPCLCGEKRPGPWQEHLFSRALPIGGPAKPIRSPFLGPSEPAQSPGRARGHNLSRGAADPPHALGRGIPGVQARPHCPTGQAQEALFSASDQGVF